MTTNASFHFYRNFFAVLCFLCLAAGLYTDSPYAYWGCMVCGALSRTAVKKQWPEPFWSRKFLDMLGSVREKIHRST